MSSTMKMLIVISAFLLEFCVSGVDLPEGGVVWTRPEVTSAALAAKRLQALTWEELGSRLNCSPIYLSSVVLGQNSMTNERATQLGAILNLPKAAVQLLSESSFKAQTDFKVLFQDPLLYRLHEINLVYGPSIKEMIHEKFGDGIMSAIDFTLDVEKDGGRVKIVMNGKFLPYNRW